jgi:hypothetical protein
VTVRELRNTLNKLIREGHGDAPVFKSVDDEGNDFTKVVAVEVTTLQDMLDEDLWIEPPRPDDQDHAVIW